MIFTVPISLDDTFYFRCLSDVSYLLFNNILIVAHWAMIIFLLARRRYPLACVLFILLIARRRHAFVCAIT